MVPNRLLKQARELKGWSQARVARELGTDATTVSRWERGLFSPTPYFRERLCTLFHKNARELGLLETVDRSSGCESTIQARPAELCSQNEQKRRQEESEREQKMASCSSAWGESSDTFAYILRSAALYQRAHALWKEAYVRALLGENAQAYQLGEASLRVFEYLGHINALAVREWLNQQALVALPAASDDVPEEPSLPDLSEQSEPVSRSARRAGNFSLALMLIGSFWFLLSLGFPIGW